MRKAFIDTLVELAESDKRIYLLTADMGYGLVEPFSEKYPDRFINVGVAEQNMIGIATGLALSGKIPFVYSIGNFPTLRGVEHIRSGICYHNLNVNIVAGNTGLTYGALGSSHHATEDIAIMRALPNMTVVVPSDVLEASLATRAIVELEEPCYLRLGKADWPRDSFTFRIGESRELIDGKDAALIATGWMRHNCMRATEELYAVSGFQVRVINMHTIKPLDTEVIIKAARETKAIITIEEHSIIGGLGSAVAEVLAESGEPVYFKRMGIPDRFCSEVGTHDELLASCHLTVDDIVREVKDAIA
ncbi:hypothetical protein LCGC14_0341120 [marine sediment metagenome]|uniref:Transketolase-like pyrimidine-binding domain-containing protein n=1 Tax=marine sediment metagenome TaxID=412755 RepID=A0A0F9TDM4_9ZZZZ